MVFGRMLAGAMTLALLPLIRGNAATEDAPVGLLPGNVFGEVDYDPKYDYKKERFLR